MNYVFHYFYLKHVSLHLYWVYPEKILRSLCQPEDISPGTSDFPCHFISTAGANTYFVSKNGNDLNSGDIRNPWLTVAKAASTLIAGDTVFIMAGIYNEPLWPLNSGTGNAPICYFAYNEGAVILHASGFNDKWGVFTIKGSGSKRIYPAGKLYTC